MRRTKFRPAAEPHSPGGQPAVGNLRWPNQALQQTGAACRLSGSRSSPSGPGC